jgi:hypothetical protein
MLVKTMLWILVSVKIWIEGMDQDRTFITSSMILCFKTPLVKGLNVIAINPKRRSLLRLCNVYSVEQFFYIQEVSDEIVTIQASSSLPFEYSLRALSALVRSRNLKALSLGVGVVYLYLD